MPACATVAKDGDEIETHTAELEKFRKRFSASNAGCLLIVGLVVSHMMRVICTCARRNSDLQLMLARHPNDCLHCEVSGNCKLQSLVNEEQVRCDNS